jgi:uncharacterized protein (DUF488 family)
VDKIKTIYTIGHSNHGFETFLNLLKQHGITCLVDVRSSPYSKYAPDFKKDALSLSLKQNNIVYLFMGDSLGARHATPSLLFENGMVNFEKVRRTDKFQEGLIRIEKGLQKNYTIALMCAEKDPFDCHRFILICPELVKKGITIQHILDSGETVSNTALEDRLLTRYKLDSGQLDLFSPPLSRNEALDCAYEKRNRDIGFIAATSDCFSA